MQCVRIAIVDPHELVVAGLTQVLTVHPASPYYVVPLEPQGNVAPDVVLYHVDPADHVDQAEVPLHDPVLHTLLRTTSSIVVGTSWDTAGPSVKAALRCGAHGILSMRLGAEELLEQLERIADGRTLEAVPRAEDACHPEVTPFGLTLRELEVLGLVGAGLTNQEIADRLFVSINSVKTYVRTAYRKVGVQRRTQAVVWTQRHGLTPPPTEVPPEIVVDDVAAV